MAVSRTLVITYGSVSTGATGHQLHDVHIIREGSEDWEIAFTVFVRADTIADLYTRIATFEANLRKRNGIVTVIDGAQTLMSKNPGVTASTWTCQSSEASFELLPSHRTGLSRAYRVRVSGKQVETTDATIGVRSQSYVIGTSPEGWRTLTATMEFTAQSGTTNPASTYGRAASTGFEDRAEAYLATLGGTWERVSPLVETTDERGRFFTATSSYRELIYDQDAAGTDSTSLVDVRYQVTTDRQASSGYPGLSATPLLAASVAFSSGVDKATSTDLDDVIRTLVLPYIRATVSRTLRLDADPVEIRNRLNADPVNNRIAGSVDFLVAESSVVSAARQISDRRSEGISLHPVLDGEDYSRDKHEGPKSWARTVSIVILETGLVPATLETEVAAQIQTEEAAGFVLTARGDDQSTTVAEFDGLGSELTLTYSAAVLQFERADVVDNTSIADSLTDLA